MGSEAIGWFSSFILVLTIGKQVHKQWKSGSSEAERGALDLLPLQ